MYARVGYQAEHVDAWPDLQYALCGYQRLYILYRTMQLGSFTAAMWLPEAP